MGFVRLFVYVSVPSRSISGRFSTAPTAATWIWWWWIAARMGRLDFRRDDGSGWLPRDWESDLRQLTDLKGAEIKRCP